MEVLRTSFKNITPSSSLDNNNQSSLREDERRGLLQMASSAPVGGGGGGGDSSGSKDVVIKITPRAGRETENAKSSNIWRDSSYDFSNDLAMRAISNNTKDFDFGTDSPLRNIPESSDGGESYGREDRVSFGESVSVRRRSNASGPISPEAAAAGGSRNSSLQRRSSLLTIKPKSRLGDSPEVVKSGQMDRPENTKSRQMDPQNDRLSQRVRMVKSGELDEDDPFDDDLPEEYKKMKFSKLTLLQLVSLILILAALACTLSIKFLREKTLFDMVLWKWELMILVLICGRLFSGWGIRIVVFFIERNFLLRKRVLYFVYGLRNAVQNVVWLALVLVAWQFIFDKRVEKLTNGSILPTVTKVWVCLLISTLVWLVKTLLVKVLASSFHVSTFFDRIQESLFIQYVIEALSGPPLVEMQEEEKVIDEVRMLQNAGAKLPSDLKASVFKRKMAGTPQRSHTLKSPTFASSGMSSVGRSPTIRSPTIKDDASKKDEGITINHLHRLNQDNVSAWNMKRLTNLVRKGVLSTLDETLHNEDETSVQITSENKAKIAAKKIFTNVAKPGSKFIHIEDLMRFMKEDEAQKAMHLFDATNDGKGISKRTLKNWVVNAFRERRALALSLDDTKTAVNKLHQMLNVIVLILIVIIWLLILKVTSSHFFVALGSQVLLIVFVFGNTCKTTFESIIFLFVMHPFDVGDRVEIQGEGVQMIVEEMNILTTVFLRFDNLKITSPNSVLATKSICNYYRSPDMGDAIDFCIHISTPMEKIDLMEERITRCIDNKKEHWYPAPMVVVRDMEDMNRMKWSIWLSHTINHQDMGERWARRSLLVKELIKVFRDLDIEYRMLPVDVNVRNLLPVTASSRTPSNWSLYSN